MKVKLTNYNHQIITTHLTLAFATFYISHFFRQFVPFKKNLVDSLYFCAPPVTGSVYYLDMVENVSHVNIKLSGSVAQWLSGSVAQWLGCSVVASSVAQLLSGSVVAQLLSSGSVAGLYRLLRVVAALGKHLQTKLNLCICGYMKHCGWKYKNCGFARAKVIYPKNHDAGWMLKKKKG